MASGGIPLDIAVVGCGPSGMAAAILLARAGHRTRIFERFPAPKPIGAGLLLQPTGMAVLARLGLLARIAAAGARIDRLDGRLSPSGRRILDVAYRDLAPGLHGIGIHRASLFGALFDAVQNAGVEVVPSTPVAAIETSADGRPVIVTGSGHRHGPFDLAIDAAGAQSVLRRTQPQREARPFAYGALWTILPLAGHDFDGGALAQRYVAARNMVGVMPVGILPEAAGSAAASAPHVAFFWSLRMDQLEAWRRRGLDAWRDEVAAIWPEAASLIAPVSDPAQMAPAFYAQYSARRPNGLRLAVIGDAAHSTSPQLGQGANMGLLDALILAEEVAAHPSLDAALAAYADKRRRHVRFYQAASWWPTPLFQSDSRLAAFGRDVAFPVGNRIPWVRRETVRALAGLKTGLFASLDPLQIEKESTVPSLALSDADG